MRRAITLAGCLVAGLLGVGTAAADTWLHWRGPEGNGTAPGANPPVEFSATENVKWKQPIPGRGSGSPIVLEDRVFVVTAVAKDKGVPETVAQPLDFRLLCYRRSDGQLLWQRTAVTATPHEGTHSTNGFASASPCSDGQRVYAHFGSRGLFGYSIEGEPIWERTDFGKMRARNGFGEGSSPTLAGDRLLVPWDHEGDSALYCLDKFTGQTLWRTSRDEPTCWATPLVVEHAGRQQVIMNGQNAARGYDLETGKELWRCAGQTQRPVASAVTLDDLVLVGSGFRGSFLGAFKLDGRGDLQGTSSVIWTVDRNTPDIASPLLSENRLYYYKAKTGILTCVDARTGQPFFAAQRMPAIRTTYASPVAAGGHVYLAGRGGEVVVIKDAAELEVVATNALGETIDATPAPVDKQLFIRGEQHLFCIEAL